MKSVIAEKVHFKFAILYSLFMGMEEEAWDGVFDGPIWKALAPTGTGGP